MYMIHLIIIYDVVNIFSIKKYESFRKLGVGVNRYTGVNWSTTAKSLRKLRVSMNRYTGVNRSTTTIELTRNHLRCSQFNPVCEYRPPGHSLTVTEWTEPHRIVITWAGLGSSTSKCT